MTPTRSAPAADAAGLISTSDFAAAGWTRAALRAAVARGSYGRERRGIFGLPEVLDAGPWPDSNTSGAAARARERQVLRAAASGARLCGRAVLGHAPAAVAHGLPLMAHSARPCLTVPPGTALRALTDLHLHRASLPPWQLARWDRYTVTTPARTCVDLAREFGMDAGVVAMDAALHGGLASASELDAVLASCTRWPGKRLARAAFELADSRSESPLESLSRLGFLRAGLSDLVPQATVVDQYGRFVARLDFLMPKLGVAGEADGVGKYEAGWQTVVAERDRERRVAQLGLEFVRWGWDELASFDVVVRDVWAAAARVRQSGRPQLWRLGRAQSA